MKPASLQSTQGYAVAWDALLFCSQTSQAHVSDCGTVGKKRPQSGWETLQKSLWCLHRNKLYFKDARRGENMAKAQNRCVCCPSCAKKNSFTLPRTPSRLCHSAEISQEWKCICSPASDNLKRFNPCLCIYPTSLSTISDPLRMLAFLKDRTHSSFSPERPTLIVFLPVLQIF